MKNENADAQNDSGTESEIIEAEDDAEIITDGGVRAAQRSAEIPEDDDYLHHTEEAKGRIESAIGGGALSTNDFSNAHGRIEILPITDRSVHLAATLKAKVGDRDVHVSATPGLTPDQAEQLGLELIESAKGARMQKD